MESPPDEDADDRDSLLTCELLPSQEVDAELQRVFVSSIGAVIANSVSDICISSPEAFVGGLLLMTSTKDKICAIRDSMRAIFAPDCPSCAFMVSSKRSSKIVNRRAISS